MSPAATEPAAWGTMACTDATGDTHWWTLNESEFEREVDVAVRRLTALGFPPDGLLLVIAGVAEAGQYAPYQRAARRLGGISCTAEPSPFDAARVAAFLLRFEVHAAIGLDAGVLEGLSSVGDAAALLGRAKHLLVRHDVAPAVRALGRQPLEVVTLGPALAVSCPAGEGMHVGADAWTLANGDDGLVVRPPEGRQVDLPSLATGVLGTVERGTCGCGSDDPRVVLTD